MTVQRLEKAQTQGIAAEQLPLSESLLPALGRLRAYYRGLNKAGAFLSLARLSRGAACFAAP